MPRILIIDNEPHMRSIVGTNLRRAGYETAEAGGALEGKRRIMSENFEVVFVDQRMPDGEGIDVVACAHEADPTLSVVMLTAVATVELAVEAMRRGAFDFLTKPFQPEQLISAARGAAERTALLRENHHLRRVVEQLEGSTEIFGSSPAMRTVRETIGRVAPTNATVLILGETGTGKELVARAIHNHSPRAEAGLSSR